MDIHANAALGPAGRLALVEAIESGMTLGAARPPRTAGGTVAKRPAPMSSHRAPGSATAARAPITSPAVSVTTRKHRSCMPAARPVLAPDVSPASAVGPVRRSGRCCTETGSHGAPAHPRPAIAATSGRAPGRCFMSISHAWHASSDRGMPSPETAPRPLRTSAPPVATSTCTAWSTITPVTPTSSSIQTKAATQPPLSWNERSPTSLRSESRRPRR